MLSKEYIAKTRHIKGFTITYQWVNGEPAMCLLRDLLGRKSAYVICLSAAHKYTDIEFLVRRSMKIGEHFGMTGERHAARIIADIIIEGLEDLVRMPPEPEDARAEREGPKLVAEHDPRTNTVILH